ncbi:hypothetical protein BdWA1_002938 [Babesia duncani]|uniref:Uncharacterized protein n=1 Tax=Babesia duncani TaxID=323732 RepID=A0AAD9UMZ1_9APIC|nr:hypothetical protein BdWA1_002938 [Babesia duncani]
MKQDFKFPDFISKQEENEGYYSSSNPSGQLRSRIMGGAQIYNQRIQKSQYNGRYFLNNNSRPFPGPSVTIPSTGEVVCVDTTDVPFCECFSSDLGIEKSKVSQGFGDPSACKLVDSPRKDTLIHKDARLLIETLNNRLQGLDACNDTCDLCATKRGVLPGQTIDNIQPCPHANAFKNVPKPFDLNILNEALDTNTWPLQIAEKSQKNPLLKPIQSTDPPTEKVTSEHFVCNLKRVNVDHLLTHAPKEETEIPKQTCINLDLNSVQGDFGTRTLTSLDVGSLRKIADKIAKNTETMLETEYCYTAKDSVGRSTSIVTFLNDDTDFGEFNKFRTRYSTDKSMGFGTSRKFSNVDLNPFNEMRSHAYSAKQSSIPKVEEDYDESIIYNTNSTIDVLLQEYIRLVKSPNCQPQLKRALKHNICHKLGKERLYIRHGNPPVTDDTDDNTAEDKLQMVFANLNRLDTIGSGQYTARDDVDACSDKDSIYTFSSLSVSSYDTVIKEVHLPVDSNPILTEPGRVHANILDMYGVLDIIDESGSLKGYNLGERFYCELIGDYMHCYPYLDFEVLQPIEPAMTLEIGTATCEISTNYNWKRILTSICINCPSMHLRIHVPAFKKKRKSVEKCSFTIKASTELENVNWYKALSSRQNLNHFLSSVLENNLCLYNLSVYSFTYPRRYEMYLDKLPLDRKVEHLLFGSLVKSPLQLLDFRNRNLTDDDISFYQQEYNVVTKCMNFENNNLTLGSNSESFIKLLSNVGVTKLILDGNPLCATFYSETLPNIALSTSVRYLSIRKSELQDSIIEGLKLINRRLSVGIDFNLDIRDAKSTFEFEHFMTTYPLNKVKVIKSQATIQEIEFANFIDCKSIPEIVQSGVLFSGRLFSPRIQQSKGCWGCFSFFKKPENLIYIYFEYKCPYFLWYNWNDTTNTDKEVLSVHEKNINDRRVIFLNHCEIILREGKRWLLLKGKRPKNAPARVARNYSILLRGYTDACTRRWFELISRTLAGMVYTEYLQQNQTAPTSRQILSFCMIPDTTDLIMYKFPKSNSLMMKFFQRLNSQRNIRKVIFTNMDLNHSMLSFEDPLVTDLSLDLLDFSFNEIELLEAHNHIFNGLAPKVRVLTYNISNNPLGDCSWSGRLFLMCVFDLQCRKVCFNHCRLGARFLEHVTANLEDGLEHWNYASLELVELEHNSFPRAELEKFVQMLDLKFPNLASIRLHASSNMDEDFNNLISMDHYGTEEPTFGTFVRKIHIKKPKKTTRESVEARKGLV